MTWMDPDGRHRAVTVTFTILIGAEDDEWFPIELCLDDTAWALDTYLQERLYGTGVQGGYFVEVDGAVWSDGSSVDELGLTMTWFPALARLCRGSDRERVGAYEESNLPLVRDGDWLELSDIHASGLVSMPRIRVPFDAFIDELMREAELFVLFVRRMRAEIARRREGMDDAALRARIDWVASYFHVDVDERLAQVHAARAAGAHPYARQIDPGRTDLDPPGPIGVQATPPTRIGGPGGS